MRIKEFEAGTLKGCLQKVRQELGPEAVILETRKLRKGGLMGWRAQDAVKIVAAVGEALLAPGAATAVVSAPDDPATLHPDLYGRLLESEINEDLARDLLLRLPDTRGWSTQSRGPLAEQALAGLMAREISGAGPI